MEEQDQTDGVNERDKGPWAFLTLEEAWAKADAMNEGKVGIQRRYHVWEVVRGKNKVYAVSDNGKQKACGHAALYWEIVTATRITESPDQWFVRQRVATANEEDLRDFKRYLEERQKRRKKRRTD